jgi:hypothetical protein
MEWYRGLKRWSWAQTLRRPRLLFPFSLSLTAVCCGLALNGFLAHQQAPWWEIIAWSLLSLLFLLQTLVYGMAGYKYGWDSSTEGARQ